MYSATEELIAWIADYGYRCSTQVPEPSPSEFVTVERTSSYVENLVDHPTFAVQTWADDECRAEEMALEIRLAALTEERPYGFYSLSPQGVYPFWDDSTRKPRYQLVLSCTTQLTKDEGGSS